VGRDRKRGEGMKRRRFYDPLYGATFYVYIGGTSKEFKKIMQKHRLKLGAIGEEDYAYFKEAMIKGRKFCFIWCESKDIIYLAHEALHATAWVFKKIGIPISRKNDDAACYYQQWILEQIRDRV